MSARRSAAHGDHDLPRADYGGGRNRAVEHEVGVDAQQQRVLVTGGLALDAVGDHDRCPAGGHGAQFGVRRESRPARPRRPLASTSAIGASLSPRRAGRRPWRLVWAASDARCRPAGAGARARGHADRPFRGHRAHGAAPSRGARCLAAADGAVSRRRPSAVAKSAMQAASTASIQATRRRFPCRRRGRARPARPDRPASAGRATRAERCAHAQARDHEDDDDVQGERPEPEPHPVALRWQRGDQRDEAHRRVGIPYGITR